MFKLVLKGLFSLSMVLLAYNYFLGNYQEKKQAEEIVLQIKSLSGSLIDLLQQEKDKYQAGKYDETLQRISDFVLKLQAMPDQMTPRRDKDQLKRRWDDMLEKAKKGEEMPSAEKNKLIHELESFILLTQNIT